MLMPPANKRPRRTPRWSGGGAWCTLEAMLRLRTTLLLCLLFGLPGSLLPIPNAQAASWSGNGQLTVTNTTTKPVNGSYTRTTKSKLGRTVTAVSPHSVIVQQYGPGDATPYTTVNQQFNGFGQPGDTAHSVH